MLCRWSLIQPSSLRSHSESQPSSQRTAKCISSSPSKLGPDKRWKSQENKVFSRWSIMDFSSPLVIALPSKCRRGRCANVSYQRKARLCVGPGADGTGASTRDMLSSLRHGEPVGVEDYEGRKEGHAAGIVLSQPFVSQVVSTQRRIPHRVGTEVRTSTVKRPAKGLCCRKISQLKNSERTRKLTVV